MLLHLFRGDCALRLSHRCACARPLAPCTLSCPLALAHTRYRNDVNRTSVLGAKGAIAEEYGELALVMWCARYRSLAPRFLLGVLARSNPMFAGMEQQDSQVRLVGVWVWGVGLGMIALDDLARSVMITSARGITHCRGCP